MESEKVKEIKKALEYNVLSEFMNRLPYADEFHKLKMVSFEDILALINELESENKRQKQANKKVINIIFSNNEENQQLKDRIAELEKENKNKTDTITDLLKKQEFYEKEKLKQFAERLKEKLFDLGNIVNENDIDETLKEFI